MIVIKSISQVKYEEHDEVWAIVRSMKHPNSNIKQVVDLSPSWDLFAKYQELKKNGQWNKQTFQDIYVPQFLHEMHSPKAITLLNQLYNIDKADDNICLVCFCPDETMCHRSIIAGLLQGVGCNVCINGDYSHYYTLWKSPEIINRTEPKKMVFRDEYYFLSNMYPAPILINIDNSLIKFNCVEAAYQAFKDPNRINDFVNLNGYDAKKLGKSVTLRPDWDEIKLNLMEQLLKAKFTQNPALMSKLKSITCEITENNTWGDTFWGICNGTGKNHLGKLLMKIRDEQ